MRIWHANTYRLESTLNYNLDRVWTIACLKGCNSVALGYDEGSIIIKVSIISFVQLKFESTSVKISMMHYKVVNKFKLFKLIKNKLLRDEFLKDMIFFLQIQKKMCNNKKCKRTISFLTLVVEQLFEERLYSFKISHAKVYFYSM